VEAEFGGVLKIEVDGMLGTEVGGTPKTEVDGTPKAEVDGMLKAEVDGWRGGKWSAILLASANFPRQKPEGTGGASTFSTSLSYAKLNVVAKNGASPDAIFLMCSISNLGSSLVKFSRRN